DSIIVCRDTRSFKAVLYTSSRWLGKLATWKPGDSQRVLKKWVTHHFHITLEDCPALP
ncbi:hypothetical protein AMTR_s01328p00010240, partial [Amborella trichopoda]